MTAAYDDNFDSLPQREEPGLGLNEFLDFDPDAEKSKGRGGSFLSKWKDKGSVIIWLHTRSRICPVFGHSFIHADAVEDRETRKVRQILRWPRFVSPDPAKVHVNQFFREADDLPQVPPDRDPFLLLREWLRRQIKADRLGLDAPVFEWVDHKERGEVIVWTAGELSGLVKRGKRNRGHSLDTKLEYLFSVIAHDRPGDGVVVARETKLLGDLMRKVIRQEVDSKGEEEGNPFKCPYAFKWVFDKNASSPMQSYTAYRYDQAACTDEIWIAIGGEPGKGPDLPDMAPYVNVGEADGKRLRHYFQQAQQIDLPLDHIFSDDARDREAVWRGRVGATPARSGAAGNGSDGEIRRPPASVGGARAPAVARAAQAEAPAGQPRARRRKKPEESPAPPPKEPEVQRVPCEECGEPLLPTQEKCPKCGAEYEIVGDPGAVQVPARAEPAVQAPATTTQQPSGGGPRRPGSAPAASASPQGAGDKECFACGSNRLERRGDAIVCLNCRQDQGDDVPF